MSASRTRNICFLSSFGITDISMILPRVAESSSVPVFHQARGRCLLAEDLIESDRRRVEVSALSNLALNDIAQNGQGYANTHGTCTPFYVKKRISAKGQTVVAGNLHTYVEYTADFYSDAACTKTVVLQTPTVIKYTEVGLTTYTNGNLPVPFNHTYQTTAPAGVSSVRLMAAWSYCIGGGPPILEVAGELNDFKKTSEVEVDTAVLVPDFEAHGVPPDPGDPDNPNYCYSSTVNLASGTGYIIK